jgi:hypothetical protein
MSEQRPIRFESIEQIPPETAELAPLDEDTKRKVEEATRFEHYGDYVHKAKFRRYVTPIHRSRR